MLTSPSATEGSPAIASTSSAACQWPRATATDGRTPHKVMLFPGWVSISTIPETKIQGTRGRGAPPESPARASTALGAAGAVTVVAAGAEAVAECTNSATARASARGRASIGMSPRPTRRSRSVVRAGSRTRTSTAVALSSHGSIESVTRSPSCGLAGSPPARWRTPIEDAAGGDVARQLHLERAEERLQRERRRRTGGHRQPDRRRVRRAGARAADRDRGGGQEQEPECPHGPRYRICDSTMLLSRPSGYSRR